jgi:hypothetical protein
VNFKNWSPEERDEYDAMLAEIVTSATDSGERADLMEAKMRDAIQAQRFWANDAEYHACRVGYLAQIKSYLKRNRLLFSYEGLLISRPRVVGTKSVSESGETVHIQALIETLTFDELRQKRLEYLRQIRAYDENLALVDRLLALADMCPEASSPIDALKMLDLTVEDYLGEAAA